MCSTEVRRGGEWGGAGGDEPEALAVTSLIPYLGAAGCLILGILLWRHTSPYSSHGGASYERRTRRRLAATILFALALICGLYGVIESLAEYFNAPLFPPPAP